MSLTTILSYGEKDYKAFRTFLSDNFPKPRVTFTEPLLCPNVSTRPALIGTAFDYLLRFHLQKLYKPKVRSTPWVADHAINGYFSSPGIQFQSYGYGDDLTKKDISILHSIKKKAKTKYAWCKDVYSYFLINDRVGKIFEVCLFLARLDNIYRHGIPTLDELRTLFEVKTEDIIELQSLIESCSLSRFEPKSHIVLNPRFATNILKADADLVVDDMLIEVKVTKHLNVSREHFNQIIGYYILYLIGGLQLRKKVKITKVAIYFARHDVLWSMKVDDIGSATMFKTGTKFLKRTLREFPLR